MRYAVIMAGGSGTRLWPMSKAQQPKQLIPFINGKSLLQIAVERLEGFLPADHIYICAAEKHRESILSALPQIGDEQYLGEPMGRDTLNAVALATAIIDRRDPDATMTLFTADHLITPVDKFQQIIARGFELADQVENSLVLFGIAPTGPATGYGYLQLGAPVSDDAYIIDQFREKPDHDNAEEFFKAGSSRYLWNSGMFAWRCSSLLSCLERYEPQVYVSIKRIADAWNTPQRTEVLAEVYPTLKKISVDYAIMEPASRDMGTKVIGVPMNLEWLDVGSWPSFACTLEHDENGNAVSAGKSLLMNSSNTLVVSNESDHLIATLGCKGMIIIHTPEVTMVCSEREAEAIKELHKLVGERFGAELL